jgi:dienelactone hydrolase
MVDAAKVALIGYCFGGMVGVEFGSTGVAACRNVAIHGSFFDHPAGWAQNAKGKFLILHGAEDVPYPLEKVAKSTTSCARPRSSSRWSSTAAPATASRCRRTRTRSARTRNRSRTTSRFLKELFGI